MNISPLKVLAGVFDLMLLAKPLCFLAPDGGESASGGSGADKFEHAKLRTAMFRVSHFAAVSGTAFVRLVKINPAEANVDAVMQRGNFETIWKSRGARGVMISGGYFDEKLRPLGWLVQNGRELSPPQTVSPYSALFSIDRNGKWDISYLRGADGNILAPKDASKYRLAIQAGPLVIEPGGRDGIKEKSLSGGFTDFLSRKKETALERTVIARSKKGEWYFIVTGPMTLRNLQSALRRMIPDIDVAMNLDGGPSSALAVEGKGVLVKPAGALPVVIHVTGKRNTGTGR